MTTTATNTKPDFTRLPDLAVRELGGSVLHATDDFYGDRENLIRGIAPQDADHMNNRGWVVDSWETRRRRSPGQEHVQGNDYVLVRLAFPGTISGIVVDTTGSGPGYPPVISVEATSLHGYASLQQVEDAEWTPIVARSSAEPNRENYYEVSDSRIFTHVRLSIYPDGSVARLRVHGRAVPDLRMSTGAVNIASLRLGAYAADCSDARQTSNFALRPGRGRSISEGWETRRHRGPGCEYLLVRLGVTGTIRFIEVDTFNYMGNAPGEVRVLGRDADGGDDEWREIVPKAPVLPDLRQLFRSRTSAPVNEVKLEIYTDGGVARLRAYAELSDAQRAASILHWFNLLPESHARSVLVDDHGVSPADADAAIAARPIASIDAAPAPVRKMVADSPWAAIPE